MSGTPLNATTRYTPPGVRQYNWVTSLSAYATPTRGEINGSTNLTAEIAEISGFELAGDSADAPDLSGGFVAQVAARVTASDCEIVFYASQNSNDVRTVLPRGTAGYLLIFPEGDVATQKMEIWPAKVKSMFVDQGIEDPGKIHIQFSITKLPVQNYTIPS